MANEGRGSNPDESARTGRLRPDHSRATDLAKTARDRGLFDRGYLDTLFANPTEHITPLRGSELWQVAALEMWMQQHGV